LCHLPQGSTNEGAASERSSIAFRAEAGESYMIVGIGWQEWADGAAASVLSH
jgi:hypothetical protein